MDKSLLYIFFVLNICVITNFVNCAKYDELNTTTGFAGGQVYVPKPPDKQLFVGQELPLIDVWNKILLTATTPTATANEEDIDDFVPLRSNRSDEFDWKLMKAILLKENSNVVFSPFSLKLLLSLLLEATAVDSETFLELKKILSDKYSAFEARDFYKDNFRSLLENNVDYELKLGTKIYVDHFIRPRQRFASILESYYFTKLESVDFHLKNEAVKLINKWCAEITNDHIEELVSIDEMDGVVMMMISAIYFNGNWKYPFQQNYTRILPFFKTPTVQVKSQFMAHSRDFYYLDSKDLDSKILRLPYKGKKFSMTIVLPNSISLNELINRIDGTQYNRAQWYMDEVPVNVIIPKFKFDFKGKFNEILQSLGITSIFTNEASLPALDRGSNVENRLKVSNVVQKAGINVNEIGTIAFAASKIDLVNKFGGGDFYANKPFLFFIEDETTGTILFAGKVIDPHFD